MGKEPTAPSSNPPAPDRTDDRIVRVAVAVVYRMDAGRPLLFVARRPANAIRGGLWEFPGGKIEPGEAPAAELAVDDQPAEEESAEPVPAEAGLPGLLRKRQAVGAK
jgi:8-oxo-dGTP pyrophosphatase MutT (NUDIX family)